MTQCIECSQNIHLHDRPMLAEIIVCSHCSAELEILSVDPIKLVKAPEIEEDWGE